MSLIVHVVSPFVIASSQNPLWNDHPIGLVDGIAQMFSAVLAHDLHRAVAHRDDRAAIAEQDARFFSASLPSAIISSGLLIVGSAAWTITTVLDEPSAIVATSNGRS